MSRLRVDAQLSRTPSWQAGQRPAVNDLAQRSLYPPTISPLIRVASKCPRESEPVACTLMTVIYHLVKRTDRGR